MKFCLLLIPVALVLMLSGCTSPTRFSHDRDRVTSMNPPAAPQPYLVPPEKLTAPHPIKGNRGKYLCPFTAAGTVAPWAQEVVPEPDNGSDLAVNVGGAVGEHIGSHAFRSLPFGLGGILGRSVGESAMRQPARKQAAPRLPDMEAVRAGSNISFNSVDKLAVYMYAKHSTHPEYPRVLDLTIMIYPELEQAYQPAIEKASRPAKKKKKKKA